MTLKPLVDGVKAGTWTALGQVPVLFLYRLIKNWITEPSTPTELALRFARSTATGAMMQAILDAGVGFSGGAIPAAVSSSLNSPSPYLRMGAEAALLGGTHAMVEGQMDEAAASAITSFVWNNFHFGLVAHTALARKIDDWVDNFRGTQLE